MKNTPISVSKTQEAIKTAQDRINEILGDLAWETGMNIDLRAKAIAETGETKGGTATFPVIALTARLQVTA